MLLLSLLLLPLLGAVILTAQPKMNAQSAGRFAMGWTILPMLLVALIVFQGPDENGILATWSLQWIPDSKINLSFSVDGISWVFLLLTSFVTLFVMVISSKFELSGRGYCALILVMQSMLFGVFSAANFIPFFLCWEMTLIPSYLLIRLWGGENAPRAAMRFFIITLFGGVSMLLGFLALQFAVGTMDFAVLSEMASNKELVPAVGKAMAATGYAGSTILTVIAIAVFLGLAVKIPVFPIPRLAARCLCGGTHASDFIAHRTTFQDGGLRIAPYLHDDFSRSPSRLRSLVNRACGDYGGARCCCRFGADRYETDPRLLIDQPPRLLHLGCRSRCGLDR